MAQTALITGANRGIGLELCRQLVARGDQVIATCRGGSTELHSLGVRVEEGVDVTSDDSIAHLVRRLEGLPIDLLINNAGILNRESLEHLDFESVRWQFEVNSIGPLRVSHALVPQMGPGSKIGIVTSRMGSITDNTSGSRYGYRMSKAAVNIAGVSLARDLAERGIAVALLHPGYVRTDMTGGQGLVDTDEAAGGLLARMDSLSMDNSGSFWHANGENLPW
ncbi:MAG: short-chain dehydrogenase [Deltaproteobacteria bacterium]|nr:short-chain dehydrogenase [Deltaproteobacteria bacterium]